jgi:hypothetical protein
MGVSDSLCSGGAKSPALHGYHLDVTPVCRKNEKGGKSENAHVQPRAKIQKQSWNVIDNK